MTPQEQSINYLKDVQIALRGLIIDIDRIQLALTTALPPPQLGPPPEINGSLRDVPLVGPCLEAIGSFPENEFTEDQVLEWLRVNRPWFGFAPNAVYGALCALRRRRFIRGIGPQQLRRFRRLNLIAALPQDRVAELITSIPAEP
jgi:hypothetical protein